MNGIAPTFGNYILLAILATIGSARSAPVPSAGLVMVLTAYNIVFGTTGVPDGFEFIVAINWLLDRLRTTVNVTGDAVVAAAIAATVELAEDTHESVPDPTVVSVSKRSNNSDSIEANAEVLEA